jgi:hypothetical protein
MKSIPYNREPIAPSVDLGRITTLTQMLLSGGTYPLLTKPADSLYELNAADNSMVTLIDEAVVVPLVDILAASTRVVDVLEVGGDLTIRQDSLVVISPDFSFQPTAADPRPTVTQLSYPGLPDSNTVVHMIEISGSPSDMHSLRHRNYRQQPSPEGSNARIINHSIRAMSQTEGKVLIDLFERLTA